MIRFMDKEFTGLNLITAEAGGDEMKLLKHTQPSPSLFFVDGGHPLSLVKMAKGIIDNRQTIQEIKSALTSTATSNPLEDAIIITFSPDVVSFVFYYTKKLNIPLRIFILKDGKFIECNNIEPIFESFNKAMQFISENAFEDEENIND